MWCVMMAFAAMAVVSIQAGGSFDLTIDDVSGLDEPWPLLVGLPFPEGALRDAAGIRITAGDGDPVAAQIDVTGRWPDGTIRWALAGMNTTPQGKYRVEYGPRVSAVGPQLPLTVDRTPDGGLVVDTRAAVYSFESQALMPESAVVNGVGLFDRAGDGAYLVDNHGRLARVHGAAAEVTSVLRKEGPGRVVVEREGWYVTEAGEKLAQARVWFYFMAGSPYVRITHSLIFIHDTNEVWLRDYGLEFPTGRAADEVVFSLADKVEEGDVRLAQGFEPRPNHHYDLAELTNPDYRRNWREVVVAPGDDEVYLLQDEYPHHIERDAYRAVIGRVPAARGDGQRASLWVDDWEVAADVAGDWMDARYSDCAVSVVMPWLAQRFPKEIAVNSSGIRVAFWAGRSGRELDFRPVTLVNEYWKRWSNQGGAREDRGPVAAEKLAAESANAQGAARTHDLWLLPRSEAVPAEVISARATAAARPPLVLADPEWLVATEAIGFPMRQYDPVNFPVEEGVLIEYWNGMMANYTQLNPTGFIDWGQIGRAHV